MTVQQLALSSLAIGVVVGVGVCLLVLWAYRTRSRAEEQASQTVPPGVAEVLAGMDDAACIVDSSGRVLAASPAASPFAIAVGATLDHPQLRRLAREVRQVGDGVRSESLRIAREGRSLDPRLVSARVSAVGAWMTLVILRDITEQERLEQMRRDFVANTSHELKTPVGAVSLLAEAIESAADDPDQVRIFAARISAEATRLGHLTGRILSLSRLQSESGLTHDRVVAVDEVVAASIEAHVVQADAAAVELVRGGEREVRVCGDVHILVEALGNLIANAIVYSPKGSRVGIGVKTDGDVVEIAVADQGIGISEADRERIFERFYRADEARSRRTGGTGLGLSIVKHAVQRHGGEVRVWSRLGQGSTFTIRLPRADTAAVGDRPRKKRQKSGGRDAAPPTASALARYGETP